MIIGLSLLTVYALCGASSAQGTRLDESADASLRAGWTGSVQGGSGFNPRAAAAAPAEPWDDTLNGMTRSEFLAIDPELRKGIYFAMSPQQKTEMWRAKILETLVTSDFAAQEVDRLEELLQFLSPGLFENPGEAERVWLNAWHARTLQLMPAQQLGQVTGSLNPYNSAAALAPAPAGGGQRAGCTCSVQSDWCPRYKVCQFTSCTVSNGCGTLWLYACDGECFDKPRVACDNFNRPDGPVGPEWTNMVGTQQVLTQTVTNVGGGNAWMQHNVVATSYNDAVVEFDLAPNPSGSSRYSAAVTGSNGVDMLFVKVQNQTGLPGYSNYAFYVGFNGGGRPGYGGFFSFGFQLDAANDGAHARVSTVNDVTYLNVDDNNDRAYEYTFNSLGTVSSLGLAFGLGVGYGAWGTGAADNWELNNGCPTGFSLAVSNPTAGDTVTVMLGDASPNRPLVLGYSLAGGGPVNVNAGCAVVTVLLSPPFTQVNLTADPHGSAFFSANVPPTATGLNAWLHAFDPTACQLSNGQMVTL